MKNKKILIIPLVMLLVGFILGTVFMSSGSSELTERESFDVENAPFFDIFFNNLLMCLLFVAGCGILSTVMALVQGFSFGVIFGIWLTMGNYAGDFALLFLPHVIFEIAAMLVASAIGFSILRYLMSPAKEGIGVLVKAQLPKFCTLFFFVLVGAVVESILTPLIYNLV